MLDINFLSIWSLDVHLSAFSLSPSFNLENNLTVYTNIHIIFTLTYTYLNGYIFKWTYIKFMLIIC